MTGVSRPVPHNRIDRAAKQRPQRSVEAATMRSRNSNRQPIRAAARLPAAAAAAHPKRTTRVLRARLNGRRASASADERKLRL